MVNIKEIRNLVVQRNDWRTDLRNGNRGDARQKLKDSNNILMEMIMDMSFICILESRHQGFRVWFNDDKELCIRPMDRHDFSRPNVVVGLKLKQLLAMYRDYLKS